LSLNFEEFYVKMTSTKLNYGKLVDLQ